MSMAIGRVILGVATTSVIGTATAGTYFFLTSEKEVAIKDLIKTAYPKKELLSKTNKGTDRKAWERYKTSNQTKAEGADSWGLNGWKGNAQIAKDLTDELITKCEEKSNDKVKNENDQKFKDFVNWCLIWE